MPFFFGGGASVDLASPSAIGSTTPNTGAFTTLSATGNTTILNNSGNFIIGTTPSSQVGMLRSGGALALHIGNTSRVMEFNGVNASLPSSSVFGWNSTGLGAGTFDLNLARDASDILAQRRSTNAQTFRLYNTYTDASNYERGFFRWSSNILELGAEAAGTGTQRQLRFPLGTVTASTPLSITQTWNSSGVTFTGIQANITDTASASASLLMDLQVGGTSRVQARKDGRVISNGLGSITADQFEIQTNGNAQFGGTTMSIGRGANTIVIYNGGALSWSSSGGLAAGNAIGDTQLFRDSAGVLAQRNSTNAQTFRLYRTYTDASNYERLGLLTTNTTRYTITSENAGTGSARSLEVSFYTSASDPTSTDITSGCFSVWKNSGTGTIKLWANDGGTMKSVALA